MADGEAETESSNIKALGTLFRITEVFLWDDAGIITLGSSTYDSYLSLEPADCSPFQTRKLNSCITTEEESTTDHTVTEYLCVEELELAQQMYTLGLPLSFGTSKARNSVTSRSRRNGRKPKSSSLEKEISNLVPQIMAVSQMENPASSTSLHESTIMSSCLFAMEGQAHDAKENNRGDMQFDESKSISALGSINETSMEPVLDGVNDANCGTLTKFEFSPDTDSSELHSEMLSSLSLYDDNLPEEILEDACSRTQILHDADFLNKHGLDGCADDSSTLYCNMHMKWDTKTLQRSSVSAESPLRPLGDYHVNFVCCVHGDWWVIWDPFYKNNYFFNVQTLMSTWYPPLGLEEYAFACSNSSGMESHEGTTEKNAASKYCGGFSSVVMNSHPENGSGFHFTDKQPDDEQPAKISATMEAGIDFALHDTAIGNGKSNMQVSPYTSYVTDDRKDEENECKDLDEQKEMQHDDVLDSYYGQDRTMPTSTDDGDAFSFLETCMSLSDGLHATHGDGFMKMRRRVRKSQSQKVTSGLSIGLLKYWHQRYSLFSRYDNGIKMDEESWFSVTPEKIAKHHAFRCGAGMIIDCFGGVGGNAIQFAMRSDRVITVDVDPNKINYAQHNAAIYGVSERIQFINDDFFKIASYLKGDVVFLAPPWGGPDYTKMTTYDLRSLKPHDGYYLFKVASKIADKVVMFLPRNVNVDQLAELALSYDPPWKLEVERNYLNGKLKSITAYFDKPTLY